MTQKEDSTRENSLKDHIKSLYSFYAENNQDLFKIEADSILVFTSQFSRKSYIEILNSLNFPDFLIDSFKSAVRSLIYLKNPPIYITLVSLIEFGLTILPNFGSKFLNSNILEYIDVIIRTPNFENKSINFNLIARLLQTSPASKFNINMYLPFDIIWSNLNDIVNQNNLDDCFHIFYFVQTYTDSYHLSLDESFKLLIIIFKILELKSENDLKLQNKLVDLSWFSQHKLLSVISSILSNVELPITNDLKEFIIANNIGFLALFEYEKDNEESLAIDVAKIMIKLEELQINEVRDMFFDKCMIIISKNQNSSELMLNAVEFIHIYLINSENFEPRNVVSISMLLAECFHDSTISVKESIANLLYFVVTNISNSFLSEFNTPTFFAFIIDIGTLNKKDFLEKSFIMIDTIFHYLSSTGINVSSLFESYDLDDDFENLMELGIVSQSQIIQEIISKFVFNDEE